MADQQLVPMIAPDGSSGEIPADRVPDAVKAGGKVGVWMTAPDGSKGVIPRENVPAAVKAGGKPYGSYFALEQGQRLDAEASHKAGFWDNAADAAKGLFYDAPKAIVQSSALALSAANGDPLARQQFAQGLVAPIMDGVQRIKSGVKQGGALGTANVLQGAGQMVPGMGGMVQDANQQIADGHPYRAYAGAVGQGIVAPALAEIAPKIIPAAVETVQGGATGMAERMYRSALKPALNKPIEATQAAVQTGLENKVPVSPKGLERLSGLIDNVNQKVTDQIQTNPNAPIDRNSVTLRAGDTYDKFSKQVSPTKDLNDISKTVDDFLTTNPDKIPATEAQAKKVGTYQQVGSKYGIQSDAQIEAQKALARGLKEELEAQFPEIKGLNAQEGKLLDLQPLLERAVGRTMNHQLLGIGTPMAAAAGEAITGSAKMGGVVGAMKGLLDSAPIKSRLASAIYWGAKRAGSPITQAAADARVAGYLSALAASGSQHQSATQESPQ